MIIRSSIFPMHNIQIMVTQFTEYLYIQVKSLGGNLSPPPSFFLSSDLPAYVERRLVPSLVVCLPCSVPMKKGLLNVIQNSQKAEKWLFMSRQWAS